MRSKLFASAIALWVLLPVSPATASVSDFRLPTEQRQQPAPDVEGPVAPDVPASRRLGPSPTPTPTPRAAQTETPPPAAARIELPTNLAATPTASPSRRPAPASSTPAIETGGAPVAEPPAAAGSALPSPVPSSVTPPRAGATTDVVADAETEWSWLWLAGAVPLLLGVLVLAGWGLRRRVQRPVGQVAVPQIERPRIGPAPAAPQPAVAPIAAGGEPLQVALEPLRLSLTLMNATLAYRLELTNRGPAPLSGLTIGADMIAAHASMTREEQLSGPRAGRDAVAPQRIGRLEPGESRVVEGEFRLPFPQIVPIRQGDAALLLPLARFRVEAEGAQAIVRTFAVGQPGHGDSLQPFRLDLGPRVYPRLVQHAFA